MAYKFVINPFTGELDNIGQTSGVFVRISGDVMTGDLEFPVTGFIMNDGSQRWRVTIDATGAIVTTLISVVTPTTGNPYGPGWFMFVTYP